MRETMQAGVELNVRIAELLGAKWEREPEATADWLSFPQTEPRTHNPLHVRVLAARFDDGRIEAWPMLPDYSGDIAAAWPLVERALGYEIGGDRKPRRYDNARLWFEDAEGNDICGDATADTLPHAICLAALEALASHPDTDREGAGHA